MKNTYKIEMFVISRFPIYSQKTIYCEFECESFLFQIVNGSFRHCVKGMIIYKNSDKSRFDNHINKEHGVVNLAYKSLSPAVYNWVY